MPLFKIFTIKTHFIVRMREFFPFSKLLGEVLGRHNNGVIMLKNVFVVKNIQEQT